LLACKPVQRLKYDFDELIEQQWLYGAVASSRRRSPIVTLQPYYLGYKVDNKNGATDQNVHSTALRGYGLIGGTGFDCDFDVVYQFGRSNGNQQHDAWASVVELDYTFADSPWKPRISALYGYGTGDRNPNDNVNNRFNSLFGFNQPWSRNDYFSWDNVSARRSAWNSRLTRACASTRPTTPIGSPVTGIAGASQPARQHRPKRGFSRPGVRYPRAL
jgi:hypothetical protein